SENFNPEGFPLNIGEDVTIGHAAVLHGCTVGDRVLIGIGAIVNDGAIIEDDVILGAGALVPPGKRLESGYVYVGNPVKQLRPLSDAERSFLPYSPQNYIELKNRYLQESRG
ncbi:MAG: gamma carbonic anhydrase family protein, partial [Pseudomonadales bacterium]